MKWSHKLYKFTEIINTTIAIYHINKLQKYNEALQKKTELGTKMREH